MGNALSTPGFSTSLGGWPISAPMPTIPAQDGAMASGPFPEPPALGALPKGSRGRALTLSAAVYGALLMGAMGLALSPPSLSAPKRTIAVALDAFDAAPAPPPPPPSGSGRAMASATSPTPQETPVPVRAPEESHPAPDSIVIPPQSQAAGPVGGGAPGGQAGGVSGGVSGGQAGGVIGGQVGGVVPPRFDAAYLKNPEPDYPTLSKRMGEEGRVILRVLVSPEGLAEQVEIRQSSGHPRLDQAALGTVRRWRFIPARRGTEGLSAWVLVPLSFQLDA